MALAFARSASAHPFGQSSVNRLLAAQVGDDRSLRIAYVLDLGELPAYAEITVADRDGDGAVTPAESDAYLDARLPRWMSFWRVRIDGRDTALRVLSRRLEAAPGENGMSTLRVLAEVSASAPGAFVPGIPLRVSIEDREFAERPGWREIRAEDSDTGRVEFSSVPREPPAPGAVRMLRIDEAEFVLRALVPAVPTPAVVSTHPPRRLPLGPIALGATVLALALGFALGRGTRALTRIDPRARLLACLALAVSAATLRGDHPAALITHAAAVLALILAARPAPRWTFTRISLALGWAALLGGVRKLSAHASTVEAVALAARTAVALCAMLPLAASTDAMQLADALAGLGLPSALAETSAATARGLWLLRDEATRVARARALRAPDASVLERVGLYGSWAGTVLARGMDRARRSQLAMELRGYDGAIVQTSSRRMGLADGALVLGCVLWVITARVLG